MIKTTVNTPYGYEVAALSRFSAPEVAAVREFVVGRQAAYEIAPLTKLSQAEVEVIRREATGEKQVGAEA